MTQPFSDLISLAFYLLLEFAGPLPLPLPRTLYPEDWLLPNPNFTSSNDTWITLA